MARGHSEGLCLWGGRSVSRLLFFKCFGFFFTRINFILFCLLLDVYWIETSPLKSHYKPVFKGWQLVLKCWYWSSSLCSTSDFLLTNTHAHTHTQNTHVHTYPTPLPLDYRTDIPYVSHQGVGTSLQGPGSQGHLGVKLLHVIGLGDGCQSVGAPAMQEVTEGGLDGGHVRREERVLNLGQWMESFNTYIYMTYRDKGKEAQVSYKRKHRFPEWRWLTLLETSL